MEELTNLIGTLGFPIAVSAYLLYERSKNTQSMKELIINNNMILRDLKELIKEKLK